MTPWSFAMGFAVGMFVIVLWATEGVYWHLRKRKRF